MLEEYIGIKIEDLRSHSKSKRANIIQKLTSAALQVIDKENLIHGIKKVSRKERNATIMTILFSLAFVSADVAYNFANSGLSLRGYDIAPLVLPVVYASQHMREKRGITEWISYVERL